MVTAMLFAGGIGARMKYSDMPKQFLEVGRKADYYSHNGAFCPSS